VEAVLTMQAVRDGVVPPTLNLKNLDPEIDLDAVVGGPRRANYRYGLTNSVRIGGNNVAVVFGAY
jgi:3-oxoacyl-[acyl-carrier-protein] synthase II/beta-ketoacyl ACP synthase